MNEQIDLSLLAEGIHKVINEQVGKEIEKQIDDLIITAWRSFSDKPEDKAKLVISIEKLKTSFQNYVKYQNSGKK